MVGVIDLQWRRVIAYGLLAQGNSRPLNGDTNFDMGVNKVFTSLSVSETVEPGEIKLSDQAACYTAGLGNSYFRASWTALGRFVHQDKMSPSHFGMPNAPVIVGQTRFNSSDFGVQEI